LKKKSLSAQPSIIRSAIDNNKKILGLCLGGQLIADVLGAKVQRHKNWEIGWFPVTLSGTKNFLVPIPPKPIMAFQYHEYSFEIPKGAEKFAEAEGCENQGFVYGPYIVGVQFHPETTKDWVKMCAEDPLTKTLQKKPYVQAPEDMMSGNKHQSDLQDWYFELLNRFVP
jgi:GMP synthase-like glutamine amidotransferase